MPTIEANIQAALFARVAALTLSPAHPVAWPNLSFTAPADRRYLRVSHLPNSTDRLFVGSSDPHQHQGILQVVVCAPLNKGEAAVMEIAGLVADHFPPDLLMADGVRVSKRADIATALIEDTEIQIPVSIRYRAFR